MLESDLSESTARFILQDIVRADLQVKALVQDIIACEGPADALHALNARAADHMRSMKSSLEELEGLREPGLTREAERQRAQFAGNQRALRRANLGCRALLERSERGALLSGGGEGPRRRPDKEGLARQASSVTEGLVALTGLVSSQVRQSEESLRTLAGSSTVVTETQEEFKVMGGVVHQSKTLLQKYGRREVTDKVLIALALVFFIACIVYVVQKRLF